MGCLPLVVNHKQRVDHSWVLEIRDKAEQVFRFKGVQFHSHTLGLDAQVFGDSFRPDKAVCGSAQFG